MQLFLLSRLADSQRQEYQMGVSAKLFSAFYLAVRQRAEREVGGTKNLTCNSHFAAHLCPE